MKTLINSPETVVADALRGMAAAHPELDVDVERRVVVRRDARAGGRVGLVSGGGSGHEPLHAGFVGYGMLSAACPGHTGRGPAGKETAGSASERVLERKVADGPARRCEARGSRA